MNVDKDGEWKSCELASASDHGLELVDLELSFMGFWGLEKILMFLGKLRLKIKRFVGGILIDSSAASRRNPPKSFMDRGGVVSH